MHIYLDEHYPLRLLSWTLTFDIFSVKVTCKVAFRSLWENYWWSLFQSSHAYWWSLPIVTVFFYLDLQHFNLKVKCEFGFRSIKGKLLILTLSNFTIYHLPPIDSTMLLKHVNKPEKFHGILCKLSQQIICSKCTYNLRLDCILVLFDFAALARLSIRCTGLYADIY